jgi:chromosome segregation ATPase
MKNSHQNLLIILALGLCGLCSWQWYGQTQERTRVQSLTQTIFDQATAIQVHTNSIASLNAQSIQMDARVSELRQTVKTNEENLLALRREAGRLRSENSALTNDVAEYKAAFEKVEAKLKEAYDGIKKQNEAVKELAGQRDEFVQKYNDSVKQRNDLVAKYNDLVQQVEKLQGAAAKPPAK